MQWSNRIALVLVCAVALAGAKAYAGGADSFGSEPPHGVAFMEKAKGTKLIGVVTIELTDADTDAATAMAARGIVRLRKGGQIATFYARVEDTHDCFLPVGTLDCVSYKFATHVTDIQNALLSEVVGGPDGILATFFDCPNGTCGLEMTPKLVEESAQLNACVVPVDDPVNPDFPCDGEPKSVLLVADIVLAVK